MKYSHILRIDTCKWNDKYGETAVNCDIFFRVPVLAYHSARGETGRFIFIFFYPVAAYNLNGK